MTVDRLIEIREDQNIACRDDGRGVDRAAHAGNHILANVDDRHRAADPGVADPQRAADEQSIDIFDRYNFHIAPGCNCGTRADRRRSSRGDGRGVDRTRHTVGEGM